MDVRRGADRPVTEVPGGRLRHAFSAGRHYDPANTSFGPLVLHDEAVLEPGAGFPEHPHTGVAVVTHVLSGALHHEDSSGAGVLLGPGGTGVMYAGRGLVHAERAGPEGCWYLQSFLLDGTSAPHRTTRGGTSVGEAVLHVLDLAAGEVAEVPGARVHLHLARGELRLGADTLLPGDAARAEGAVRVTAAVPSCVLAWSLPG